MPDTQTEKEKTNLLLKRLKKQRLILKGKDKVVYEGDFLDIYDNFIVLSNVIITGDEHTVKPPWALVEKSTISHIHPISEVKTLSK